MKVYLIRHAQSEGNVMDMRARMRADAFNTMLIGSHAHALTAEGERQARALAERMDELPIKRLYTSPFARTLATAEILGARWQLTPMIVDELHEVLPNALGQHIRDASLRTHYLRSFAELLWWRNEKTWISEYMRAKSAWAHITEKPAIEIAAVSHGWLITLILFSLRSDRRWRVINRDVNNCGVSVVVQR